MFDSDPAPRLFGLPPGVDFPRALVDGLLDRCANLSPLTLAQTHIIVNTTRMRRRLIALFDDGPARLLPKIHLVTQLDMLDPAVPAPEGISPLRRRLELISLVAGLIERQPDLAPRSSVYDLTDSLARLMDEMQGEGVSADAIEKLDVSDQSGHWQRAQSFIRIAQAYLDDTGTLPDAEACQRQHVIALAERWRTNPLKHPVILAGSTGSRGTTMMLMQAVAALPQGALVSPGFDYDLPVSEWPALDDPMLSEDHPQFRFHKLLNVLGFSDRHIPRWHDAEPPSPARNALVSLSLRPAPVTDAWLAEGPDLQNLNRATQNITMLEAPDPRSEALAIALKLRAAAEAGQKAAVITPDRMLTRQITATLDQWDLLPDDSAGSPLHLSPPGRLLRHLAGLLHRPLDAEALLTILKHPLTHSASDRGQHVLNTQRLELYIRQNGMPYPDAQGLTKAMAPHADAEPAVSDWVNWIVRTLMRQGDGRQRPLSDWVAQHITLAEAVSAGPLAKDSGELWKKKAGEAALQIMTGLQEQAAFGSDMFALGYADLVGALLADGEVRDRDAPHPDIMIWGTLEARVQGADLVILASLNDGTWPEAPPADPWLNRALRHQAGLLLPERRIGLSAHDYQQAIAAPEVWITRAIRSDDAETVASRWLNRLRNLLEGLKTQDGPALVKDMIARGDTWLAKAAAFEAFEATPSAKRPSPRPPAAARPRRLAVTDIKHLIRDPYAIYAKHVLKLRKVGPLLQTPDALLRGTVSHDVMEAFIAHTSATPEQLTPETLHRITQEVLINRVPWPAARQLWQARLAKIADWFVANEIARRETATPAALEVRGQLVLPELAVNIIARADRIDVSDTGAAFIYDYKTGTPPKEKEQALFDKQLLIEAAMVEQGAFEEIRARPVERAVFIGLGSKPDEVYAPLAKEPPAETIAGLKELIRAYLDPQQGFTARRMVKRDGYPGDYDQLARFGEWDGTDDPVPEVLK